MENILLCPTCKNEYEKTPIECYHCGFPFTGTKDEKTQFIAEQIMKKGKIRDTSDSIIKSRYILLAIAAFTFLSVALSYSKQTQMDIVSMINVAIGFLFLGSVFTISKKPVLSIVIPLIVLLSIYTLNAVYDPNSIAQGFLWKVIAVGSLVYSLFSIYRAEKIKKESDFLNKKNY